MVSSDVRAMARDWDSSDLSQGTGPTATLTAELIRLSRYTAHEDFGAGVAIVARDCLIDWLACALAGSREDASRHVVDLVTEEGANGQASLVGLRSKVSAAQAALANGTASHALDYDDVNLALPGHVGVAVLPGLVALAETRTATVDDMLRAFVVGYEFACRVGQLVAPAHYGQGFHATGTVSALGAATACAHLLGLSRETTLHAVGLAATQAAGLKCMFGSMAKPLHAGMAAQTGVRSALLAQKGFTSHPDALTGAEGFAMAHGGSFDTDMALGSPANGCHLLNNIFKFHAACFSTHSTIEAISELSRVHGLSPAKVDRIEIEAGENCTICNIQDPKNALEAKFSLRAAAAFAVLKRDTGVLETFAMVTDHAVREMIGKVAVRLDGPPSLSRSRVTVWTTGGQTHSIDKDCGEPLADKTAQSVRVHAKFRSLASRVIGTEAADRIVNCICGQGERTSVSDLMSNLNSDVVVS